MSSIAMFIVLRIYRNENECIMNFNQAIVHKFIQNQNPKNMCLSSHEQLKQFPINFVYFYRESWNKLDGGQDVR